MSEFDRFLYTGPGSGERVLHAAPGCRDMGCQLAMAQALLDQAREKMEAMMDQYQDVALWCGVGGHAFSPLDPGRQRVTVQQWDEDAQETKPVQVAVCGDHARPVVLATRPKPALAAGNGTRTVDAEEYARYQAYLEAESRKPITEPPADYQAGVTP